MAGTGENPFAGLSTCPVVEGAFYSHLQLGDPWTAILGQLFNHSVTCCLGYWPGDTRLRWLWFHNGFTSGGAWIYVYQDEYTGDGHNMSEATFMSSWLGTLFASSRAGEFTPY